MKLPLDKIRTDGGTQPRSALNYETVDEYADLMKMGVKFPAITVYYDGSEYWLADGFHRKDAAWQAELVEIEADIIQGTLDDAKWHSFGVNKSHGLRRTNEDKQRAVKAALEHPRSNGLSDSAIAKHVGVAVSTVGDWRKRLGEVSLGNLKIESRTVSRAGTTYQQNVTNIGRPPRSMEASPDATTVPEIHAKAKHAERVIDFSPLRALEDSIHALCRQSSENVVFWT